LVFRVEGPVKKRKVKQQKRDSARLDPVYGGQMMIFSHQRDMLVNTAIVALHDAMNKKEVVAVDRGLHPFHQSVGNGLPSDQRVHKPHIRSPQKVRSLPAQKTSLQIPL
jgi:hypothetical protein